MKRLMLFTSIFLASPGTFAQVPSTFWGGHFNSQTTLSTYPSTLTLNTVRLWDTGTSWHDMQNGVNCNLSNQSNCNFGNFDSWMNALPSGVDIILTIGGTPHFIATNGMDSTCFNGPAECDPPTDLNCDGTGTDATFSGFMEELWTWASAQSWYSGRNWYVEIWNEPNNDKYWNNTYITGTLCSGSGVTDAPQQMLARMASDAKTAVQGIDSSVKMLTPPVANAITETASGGWWYNYIVNDGGGSYANVMSVHGYLSGSSDTICCGTGTLVNNTLAAMTAGGQSSKPLFISEGSWGQTAPTDPAGWTARYYTLMLSGAKVARFDWYNYDSSPAKLWAGPGTNTFTTTGSALNVLQNDWGYLGATFAGGTTGCATTNKPLCTGAGNIRTCSISEGGGTAALVAWYDSPGNSCSFTPSGMGWVDYRDISNNVTTYSSGAVTLSNSPIELEK